MRGYQMQKNLWQNSSPVVPGLRRAAETFWQGQRHRGSDFFQDCTGKWRGMIIKK